MLKHGAEHHTGIQDAIIRNLEACQQLTAITRTSLGPNGVEHPPFLYQPLHDPNPIQTSRHVRYPTGMNKLIINHLEQLIVTSDCATILKEM